VVVTTTGGDHGGWIVEVGEAHQGVGGTPDKENLVNVVAEPGEDGSEKVKKQILDKWRHVGQGHGIVRDRRC